jgi:CMP-N,N'-diacetyllegionaminic acid synthase
LDNKILFIVPARGGSKGIPKKNIKKLLGKPLLHYSLDFSRLFVDDKDICLTTDSIEIMDCAKEINYETPFLRPLELATDDIGSFEVLKHAIKYYDAKGILYDVVVLLQPTSPFRKKQHLEEALNFYSPDLDMVVSVSETGSNPYFNIFEEDLNGYLKKSKGDKSILRRQDAPPVYEFNGSIYIINANSIRLKSGFNEFKSIKKYLMTDIYSVDIDSMLDWHWAEYLIEKKLV